MRPLNKQQRIWVTKVRGLRAKGLTWKEIADTVGSDVVNLQSKFERLEYRELKTASGGVS